MSEKEKFKEGQKVLTEGTVVVGEVDSEGDIKIRGNNDWFYYTKAETTLPLSLAEVRELQANTFGVARF